MSPRKAHKDTFSIYVRFRKRRLCLRKKIGSLEAGLEALRAMRAERFHDADQLFLIDDTTGKEISGKLADAALGAAGGERPGAGPGAEELLPDAPGLGAVLESPLTRMQRSISAARAARSRYADAAAALAKTLVSSPPCSGAGALRRLLRSMRALDDLGGRALEQLDALTLVLARFDEDRSRNGLPRTAANGPSKPAAVRGSGAISGAGRSAFGCPQPRRSALSRRRRRAGRPGSGSARSA